MKRKYSKNDELISSKKIKLKDENRDDSNEEIIENIRKELKYTYSISSADTLKVIEILHQYVPKIQIFFKVSLNTKNHLLSTIKLAQNEINDIQSIAISFILQKNLPFTILNLNNCKISKDQLQILTEALKTNKYITSLNLSKNKIEKVGGKILAEILKINKNLTNLILKNNNLGDEGAIALAKAIEENNYLTALNLGKNKIGKKGIQEIARVLNKTSIMELSLYSNNIRKGMATLADSLEINDKLIKLNLDKNRIYNEGVKELAKALKANNTLTSVSIRNNKITKEGIKSLMEAVKTNNSLINIEINNEYGFENLEKSMLVKNIQVFLEKNKNKFKKLNEHALEIFKLTYRGYDNESTSIKNYYEKIPLHLFKYLFSLNENVVAKFFNQMLSTFLKKEKKYFFNKKDAFITSEEEFFSLKEQVTDKNGKSLVRNIKENYLLHIFFIKKGICTGEDIGTLKIFPKELLIYILEKVETDIANYLLEESYHISHVGEVSA